jgi:hypothetical protein
MRLANGRLQDCAGFDGGGSTMARSDAPYRWRTVTLVVVVGGTVGWALARYRRVVLAPILTDAGAGEGTGTGTGGPRATVSGSESRGPARPTAAGGAGTGGAGGSERDDAASTPPRAFRTADALAGAAAEAAASSGTLAAAVVSSDSGTGGPATTAGTTVSDLDRPLSPPAWASSHGTVEETVEAGPQEPSLASDIEVVDRTRDPLASPSGDDRLVEERAGGGGSEAGIAHPGTLAAGLGDRPTGDPAADPWGADSQLGAAGRGPGDPAGDAFGAAAAEALFAGGASVDDIDEPAAADEISPRVAAVLPEGIRVEPVDEDRPADSVPVGIGSVTDVGTGVGGFEVGGTVADTAESAMDASTGNSGGADLADADSHQAGGATVGVAAGDAALGIASARAIGHGVGGVSTGAEDPESDPSLAELQGEARDMVLGTGTGTGTGTDTDPGAGTGAGAAGTTDRSPSSVAGDDAGTADGAAGRSAGGASGGTRRGGSARAAAPESFVPRGAVAGGGSPDCPDGYPIKGNASSRIFHEPGGSSYRQTVPEFCFATAEDAENAGYRSTKR